MRDFPSGKYRTIYIDRRGRSEGGQNQTWSG